MLNLKLINKIKFFKIMLCLILSNLFFYLLVDFKQPAQRNESESQLSEVSIFAELKTEFKTNKTVWVVDVNQQKFLPAKLQSTHQEERLLISLLIDPQYLKLIYSFREPQIISHTKNTPEYLWEKKGKSYELLY